MNRGEGKVLPYSRLPIDFLPIRKSTSFLPISLPYSRIYKYKGILLKLVDESSMRNIISVNIPTNDLLISKWKIVTLQGRNLADSILTE